MLPVTIAQHTRTLTLALALTAVSAQASVDIANAPLFVTAPVIPALILAIDDSGSMDSEVLMRTNDGALWWHTGDQSFVGRNQTDEPEDGVINFNKAGGANSTWKKYVYLFPNGTGLQNGRRAYADSTNDHYAIPPFGAFAFARSPEYNLSYFDPAVDYQPWPDLGGYSFGQSDPTRAKTDPVKGSVTFDLTQTVRQDSANHLFRLQPGMSIPAGTLYKDATLGWTTAASDIPVTAVASVPIAYFPATFYLSENTSLPEGFGFKSSAAIRDGRAPDGSTLVRYEIRPENFTSPEAYTAAINNFANWFTYYRKRHIATRGAVGMAFKDIQGFRIGLYTINKRPNPATNLVFRNLSDSAQRTAFFRDVYNNTIGSGGTPNRYAVNHMRTQFARTDSGAPITEECQMNFGILFTDGYSNPDNLGIGNRDRDMGSPYADAVSNTMADIGAALYLDNPRPDLTPLGRVPTPIGCSLATPPAGLDCNTNLHVNLFGVTMGAPGSIFNVDLAATADPFSHPPTWPTNFPARNPVHVDDLWHATLNSRGLFMSVEVPSQLGERFADILANIAARLETSATSAATSSAVLQRDTLLYRAGFRSDDWSGSFTAHAINDDGSIGALVWDAEDELLRLGAANRRIFTRAADTEGNVRGVEFIWANLDEEQKEALNHNASDIDDGLGSDRLDWLRGDQNANSAFRDRQGRLLGDIINSDPVYHQGVLYVGANDGMLHAFDADSGEELFAYIPSELLRPDAGHQHAPLSRLMEPDYAHRYLMDGTVAIARAPLGGTTRSVLVGTTGLGGRTLFALDVSDPTHFDENDVLWEFSDPALGVGSGPPFIGQLDNGTWAVLLGNGYNSATERAALIAVSLEDGTRLAVVDTGSGDATTPNGLGPVTVTDWPELNLRAQRAYAGDLLGQLWRFDLRGDPNDWEAEQADDDGQNIAYLLFSATDASGNPQPITAPPAIGTLPDDPDHIVITFGTGSYIRNTDATDTTTQSLYGIYDTRTGISTPVLRSSLLSQSITNEVVADFGDEVWTVRTISQNTLDASTPQPGWVLDLDRHSGERLISKPAIDYGAAQTRVRFSTLVPDSDPCGSGRQGFVMELNLATGGQLAFDVFDFNHDGLFDDGDKVEIDGTKVTVSGIGFGAGEEILMIEVPDRPIQYGYAGSDDPGDPQDDNFKGRKSSPSFSRQGWRQLR